MEQQIKVVKQNNNRINWTNKKTIKQEHGDKTNKIMTKTKDLNICLALIIVVECGDDASMHTTMWHHP